MNSAGRHARNRFFLLFVLVLCLSLGVVPLARPAAQQQQSTPPATQDQDDDVVRVTTDLVVVNATVTNKTGQFVGGLKAADFHIFEDGAEQKVASFTAEETPFAAAILLDTSGSMESRLTLGRSAAIRFLDGLRDEDVAAVYNFDSKVEQLQDFSPVRDLAPRAFALKTKMVTALNDAVVRASEDLSKRQEKRRAILILSDGGENASRATSGKALDAALQAGVTVYAVNMSPEGSNRDLAAAGILRNFTEKTGGRYIDVPGGQALRDAFGEVVSELGRQYTIAYRPTNRARDGKWRAIKIEMSKPEVTARTRKGYKAPKGS